MKNSYSFARHQRKPRNFAPRTGSPPSNESSRLNRAGEIVKREQRQGSMTEWRGSSQERAVQFLRAKLYARGL